MSVMTGLSPVAILCSTCFHSIQPALSPGARSGIRNAIRRWSVSFRFFSKPTSPSQPTPAGIGVGVASNPVPPGPLEVPEFETPGTPLDALSIFSLEDPSAAPSRPAAVNLPEREETSRYVRGIDPGGRGRANERQTNPGDFRDVLRETEIVLQRLTIDGTSLHAEFGELRTFGDYLARGYARLGDICRVTENRTELMASALDAIHQRIEAAQQVSATTAERVASLSHVVAEVEQCVARFNTQKDAIEQSRHEVRQVAQLMNALEARVTSVTQSADWIRQAQETGQRLERRAVEATAHFEERINHFDAHTQAAERASAKVTQVIGTLNALESRVAALSGRDNALTRAEATVSQVERRIVAANGQLEEMERRRRSCEASRVPAARLRPLQIWTMVVGAVVALNMLAVVLLRTRDQSNAHVTLTGTVHQEPPQRVSPQPRRLSGPPTFENPVGRAAATMGAIAADELPSANLRSSLRVTRTTEAVDGSRPQRLISQTVQPYVGVLTVDSEPRGSLVFVDRQEVGRTPIRLARMRAGSHAVRIDRDGYDRWTTAVLVVADQQARVKAKLQAVR